MQRFMATSEIQVLKNRSVRISRLVRLRYGLLIGLGVAILVLAIWSSGLFSSFRLGLNNVQYTQRETSDQVVIVALDDPSLAEYGRISDWSRTLYADLVNELTADGANVIAFDVLFAEPSENPADDEAFAQAIADARRSEARTRVVMPIAGEGVIATDESYEIQYRDFIQPTTTLSQNVRNFGFVNAIPDTDSLLRGQHLRAKNTATGRYEVPLSVAAYVTSYNVSYAMLEDEGIYRPTEDHIFLIDMEVPVNDEGRMLINFFGNPQIDESFAVYSFKDVVQGNTPDGAFTDKIVLVGMMNATGLTDTYLVPLSLSGESMSGVAVHANVIETLLSEWFLVEQSPRSQAILIIVVAILASVIFTQLSWRLVLLTTPILLAGWFVISILYGNVSFVVMNLFDPVLALIIPMPIALAANVYLESNRRRWIEILLNSAMRISNQHLDRALIVEAVAEDAQQILPIKQLSIWLWDEYEQELQPMFPEVSDTHLKLDNMPLANKMLQLAKRVVASSHTIEEDYWLGIPLRWQEQLLGVIVAEQEKKQLSSVQRQSLSLFILQTSATLANAHLYTETQALSEFKTRMIRMASHDLKNPIGVVYGYIDLLIDDPEFVKKLDETENRYLQIVIQTAQQMNGIVEDILNLERVRAGNIITQPYLLSYVVNAAVERYEMQAEQKTQTLTAKIDSDLPMMIGDEQQLREAINNLVGNAVKYTPEGGHINVELSQKNGKSLIKIQDDGVGIAKESQDRLFQEFYRVRTEATIDIQGTGLGLSLVKSIIEAHKGRVWVESDEGQGSTFFIELPLSTPEQLAKAGIEEM